MDTAFSDSKEALQEPMLQFYVTVAWPLPLPSQQIASGEAYFPN
jgi:hypothetical protein